MVLTAVVLVLIVLAALAGAWWERRRVPPPVVAEVPAPEPEPKPEPQPVARVRMTTLHLVTANGRLLETVTIPASHRRPTYRRRAQDGTVSVFVAAGPAKRGWEYRRIAVERDQ